MSDLTVEMVQRGRGPSTQEAARRLGVAREIRSAREKLTSQTGLERAFDHELLRHYAQSRAEAAVPLGLFAIALAAAATFWVPAAIAGAWALGVFVTITLNSAIGRRFLGADPEDVDLARWRHRFVAGEVFQSLMWSAMIGLGAVGGWTFALFGLVIAAAVSTMLAATVPMAAVAALLPLSLATLALLAFSNGMDTLMLVAMAGGTQIFFLGLSRRLYASTVGALHSRAEKDAVFGELEQAKANSDEARRRAEEANLAKSRFLATMSHELRTPLNAILGFSEVMKNEVFGTHAAPSYREYSNDIHDSGMHLLNLINEILDLSRIEAGRYELNEEPVLLAGVVEECRHMMALRAKAKNQIVHDAVDGSLPRLWADERALRQIVLNLLSNAVKFTPPGGEIWLKVGWTALGGQYLSVQDSGPGIPEDELGTVMSSFGRGALAIKTAEQGSGLGLPIVKGLVELHGGQFQLRSRPREGTEVIVTLPAARVMETLPAVAVDEVVSAERPAKASRPVSRAA